MKKILLSTALIGATAGMAAAEITLSGSGRFGLNYDETRSDRETQLELRFRTEINGKVETDSGVTFGGRVRLQYSAGTDNAEIAGVVRSGATLSAAYVYASFEGFRVEVGNANGALDSAALMYNSEIGYTGFGAGDPIGITTAFSSGPYSDQSDRVGVFVSYSVGDLNARISYHTEDQTSSDAGDNFSLSADYKFGAVTVSGGYEKNNGFGSGDAETDNFALAAEYAFNDVANVGLLYFDVSGDTAADDANKVTLYGNYKFDAVTVRAFISGGDNLGTEDTAYGLGVDYDLGGATLAAGIQNDFNGDTYAEAGVNFSF